MQGERGARERGDLIDENDAAWLGEEEDSDGGAESDGWETVDENDGSEEDNDALNDDPSPAELHITSVAYVDDDDTLDILDLYTT